MTAKALSQRAAFKNGVVLRAEYASAPGMSGVCELGVRWLKRKTEIWLWDDENGTYRAAELPAGAGCGALVEAMAADEVLSSAAINPWHLTVINDWPPLGQILGMAWSAQYENQQGASLLAAVDWNSLERLAKRLGGLNTLAPDLDSLVTKLSDHDLAVDDLDRPLKLTEPTVDGLKRSVRRAIAEAIRKRRSEEQAFNRAYEPFRTAIDEMIVRWAAGKPQRRYPGAGMLPPLGRNQLATYLREYVLAHGALPSGKHVIPAGPDISSSTGPAFEVDFDAPRDQQPV